MLDDPAARRRHLDGGLAAPPPRARALHHPRVAAVAPHRHVRRGPGAEVARRPAAGRRRSAWTVRTAEPPATAADAVALLERAHDRWDAHLGLTDDERLGQLVGPVAGASTPTGPAPRTSCTCSTSSSTTAPRSRSSATSGAGRQHGRGRSARRAGHPRRPHGARRVRRGAADRRPRRPRGRATAGGISWPASWSAGRPISTTGRTPLHLAAGAGELAVVKLLLDHGADPEARDPEFHATPLPVGRVPPPPRGGRAPHRARGAVRRPPG